MEKRERKTRWEGARTRKRGGKKEEGVKRRGKRKGEREGGKKERGRE